MRFPSPAVLIPKAGHETLAQPLAAGVLQSVGISRHTVSFQDGGDLPGADPHIGEQRRQNLPFCIRG